MEPSQKSMSLGKGIAFLLLGLMAMIWPGFTVAFLFVIISSLVIIAGIMAVVAGLFNINKGWGPILGVILGILVTILGISALIYPVVSAVTYIWIFAAYLIISGIILIFSDSRESGQSRGLQIADGSLSAILGVLLLFFPLSTSVVVYWILAIYAAIAGVIIIIMSMSSRGGQKPKESVAA